MRVSREGKESEWMFMRISERREGCANLTGLKQDLKIMLKKLEHIYSKNPEIWNIYVPKKVPAIMVRCVAIFCLVYMTKPRHYVLKTIQLLSPG